jgi:cystathionine beta-lyase
VVPLEGTYLAWIDCRALQMTSEAIARKLIEDANVRINEGTMYGAAGEGFIRINLATQRVRLTTGLEFIRKALI